MSLNLNKLFSLKQSTTTGQAPVNPDERQTGETYTQYGTRICAKVNGSTAALQPCLQRVYLQEKHAQSQDQILQNKRRDDLRQEIVRIEGRIAQEAIEENHIRTRIEDNKSHKLELCNRLSDAESRNGETNKMALVKMNIGIVILVILTVYLFMFYSSTFYSAFFKEFSFDTGVAEAMFDRQALPNAFHQGFGCLIFIMCAPIIFMGLGYVLHYYAAEKGSMKYFKITAVLAITFSFDCILAYLIAKKIYDMEVLTKLGSYPDFSPSLAIMDANVWAVIFCGFITYMIWGFVFDLTMSAYEELKSNRSEIKIINNEIKQNEEEKRELDRNLADSERKSAELLSRKRSAEYRLSNTAFFYDENILRRVLTEFFTGWITLMAPMGRTSEEQSDARNIYNQTINELFT